MTILRSGINWKSYHLRTLFEMYTIHSVSRDKGDWLYICIKQSTWWTVSRILWAASAVALGRHTTQPWPDHVFDNDSKTVKTVKIHRRANAQKNPEIYYIINMSSSIRSHVRLPIHKITQKMMVWSRWNIPSNSRLRRWNVSINFEDELSAMNCLRVWPHLSHIKETDWKANWDCFFWTIFW